MNRAERRNGQRLDESLMKWINKLSPDRFKLITEFINRKVDKQVWTLNQSLDTCIIAALYTDTTLAIEDVKEIMSIANKYMEGSEEFLIKHGEDWTMKLKEIEPKIKEECLNLIEDDKSQAETIKALREIFIGVPTKDLVIIYKNTKEEWCKPKITKDDSKSVQQANTGNKKQGNAITPKKENKRVQEQSNKQNGEIKPKFEVVEQKITLKGQFGTYIKSKEGVQAGQEHFKDSTSVDNYVRVELDKMDKNVESEVIKLQEQIDELYRNADKEKEGFKLKTEEIKAVFAY